MRNIIRHLDLKSWFGGFPDAFNVFLLVHTSFLIFTRLPAIFINTMMMVPGEGIEAVLLYNASLFAAGAVFMVVATYVLKKTGARFTTVIGILSYLSLYLLIIALGSRAAQFHLLIGLVNGFADGFYWLSYGQLLTSTLNSRERDRGLAVINVIASLVSLVIPFLAGLLIRVIGGLSGYITVMAIASVIAVATCVLSVRLPNIRSGGEGAEKKTDFIAAVRVIRQKPLIFSALMGQCSKGIREGAFAFMLNVALYQIIRDEFLIGVNTLLSSAAGILAYAYMSRAIRPDNRIRFMKISIISLCFLAAAGAGLINPVMLILYSVVNAALIGPILNGGYTVLLDTVTNEPAAKSRQPELLTLNDCFLVTGRCIGLTIIFIMGRLFGQSVQVHLISLLLLSLTQFLTIHFSGRADRGVRSLPDYSR